MTKRERLYPEIKELREEHGLTFREIGERFEISGKTASDYFHDPDNSRHAARHKTWDAKDAVAGRCPKCGGVMPGASVRAGAERCISCFADEKAAARSLRDDDIVVMWNEGMSARAIADELGYGPNSNPPEFSRLMAEGRIQARREGYRRKHAQGVAA